MPWPPDQMLGLQSKILDFESLLLLMNQEMEFWKENLEIDNAESRVEVDFGKP